MKRRLFLKSVAATSVWPVLSRHAGADESDEAEYPGLDALRFTPGPNLFGIRCETAFGRIEIGVNLMSTTDVAWIVTR